MPGTMAITMAGFGTRFAKAGYDMPKYRIEVLGRTLFDWSMSSLDAFSRDGWNFMFAVRAEDKAKEFILDSSRRLGINVKTIIELPSPTDGQATTAMMLAEKADVAQPFAVFNIDTFVKPGVMAPHNIPADCKGWVPCFAGDGDGWSFVRIGEDGKAVELREKQRISPHATVGFYWFETAMLYMKTYKKFFAHGGEEKGEKYIAPLYNQLISDGQVVRICDIAVEDVGLLGTPEQVEVFKKNPPNFSGGNL